MQFSFHLPFQLWDPTTGDHRLPLYKESSNYRHQKKRSHPERCSSRMSLAKSQNLLHPRSRIIQANPVQKHHASGETSYQDPFSDHNYRKIGRSADGIGYILFLSHFLFPVFPFQFRSCFTPVIHSIIPFCKIFNQRLESMEVKTTSLFKQKRLSVTHHQI